MVKNLNNIFASLDAFDKAFQSTVASRFLVFPTAGYMLNEGQFSALAQAAAAEGDLDGICVITEVVDQGVPPNTFDKFTFPLSSYESYRRLEFDGPVILENALISPKANWGVLFSQENHALIGGSHSFGERFRGAYPQVDRDLEDFVNAWKAQAVRNGSDIAWLPALLEHLKGRSA